jgi:nucleoside-diphosphate-sugar epimerase
MHIDLIVNFLNSKKQQIILGDISQVRSYIYVKKAALIIKNMINKFDNKIVNLGNYRTLSIEDFIKKYTKIANFKIKIISSKKKSEYFKYHSKYINTHNDNFYINFKEIFIQQKKLLQNV